MLQRYEQLDPILQRLLPDYTQGGVLVIQAVQVNTIESLSSQVRDYGRSCGQSLAYPSELRGAQ
jgi:hypothetical protein